MEATHAQLQKHVKRINAVLQETCNAHHPSPLVQEADGVIALTTSCPPEMRREVTTDLGIRDIALRLPVPDTNNPRFWAGIRERWEWRRRHKASFCECSLRLYVGDRSEDAVQFLRLEWIARVPGAEGTLSYQGKHAAHPHWHVDRSALVGQEEYFRSLEILTAPDLSSGARVEDFGQVAVPSRPILDFSWLQKIHLPAQAEWMGSEWDGYTIPGPHQCEPNSFDQLVYWWTGALKYCSAELPR
jgi:hypothetical protein